MSAIVGRIWDGPDPFSVTAWGRAVAALSQRVAAGSELLLEEPGISVAFRGSGSGGTVRTSDLVALADCGSEQPRRQGDVSGIPHGGDAAGSVLEVFRESGAKGLSELTGAFALTIVDLGARAVTLTRDRLGFRPLFYGRGPSGWVWGSEQKLLAGLLPRREIDVDALSEVFHFRWLASSRALLRGVRQVRPGTAVTFAAGSVEPVIVDFEPLCFRPAEDGKVDGWVQAADDALDAHFQQARSRYKRVCVFLSGGVDSSILAAKAMRAGFERCFALTAYLPGWSNPELDRACEIAESLGMEHQLHAVGDRGVARAFPRLLWRLEQPPRHYNGLVVSHLMEAAARQADAVLWGEGADLMFGPASLRWISEFQRRSVAARYVPASLGHVLRAVTPTHGDGIVARIARVLSTDPWEFAATLHSLEYQVPPMRVVKGVSRRPWPDDETMRSLQDAAPILERFQQLTLQTELRSHLDAYDRLATPNGVEVLTPFLSEGIRSMALCLPTALKMEGSISKPVLRRLACRYFPEKWVYAKKRGFPTPIESWLQGPLRPWLDLLLEKRTLDRNLFEAAGLRRALEERDTEMLWTALSLEVTIRLLIEDDLALLEGEGLSSRKGLGN